MVSREVWSAGMANMFYAFALAWLAGLGLFLFIGYELLKHNVWRSERPDRHVPLHRHAPLHSHGPFRRH